MDLELRNHERLNNISEKLNWLWQVLENDIKTLTTGNVAHHKASMGGKITDLKNLYVNNKEFLRELELKLLDEWCEGKEHANEPQTSNCSKHAVIKSVCEKCDGDGEYYKPIENGKVLVDCDCKQTGF